MGRRQLLLVDGCEHANYAACLLVRTIGLELTINVRNTKTESDWSSNTRAPVCVCGCWRGLSAVARLVVKLTTDN